LISFPLQRDTCAWVISTGSTKGSKILSPSPVPVVLDRASRLLARKGEVLGQKAIDRCFPTELPDRRFEKILSRFITIVEALKKWNKGQLR
jgi:hypothetical protein